jgi:hypothetical protein
VEDAQNAEIAIEVEAAFEVEYRSDSARARDSLDVTGVERQFDLVRVARNLPESKIDEPQRLPRLEARRVVFFANEQGEEHGVEAAFFRTRQIDLAVIDALADVTALVELAVDHVNVSVENQGVPMNRARVLGVEEKGSQ